MRDSKKDNEEAQRGVAKGSQGRNCIGSKLRDIYIKKSTYLLVIRHEGQQKGQRGSTERAQREIEIEREYLNLNISVSFVVLAANFLIVA